jgi:hypothetical protein
MRARSPFAGCRVMRRRVASNVASTGLVLGSSAQSSVVIKMRPLQCLSWGARRDSNLDLSLGVPDRRNPSSQSPMTIAAEAAAPLPQNTLIVFYLIGVILRGSLGRQP